MWKDQGALPFLPCIQMPGPTPRGCSGPVNSLPFLSTTTFTSGVAKTNCSGRGAWAAEALSHHHPQWHAGGPRTASTLGQFCPLF